MVTLNVSWTPKQGSKIGFQKFNFFDQASADLVLGNIQALRKAGSGYAGTAALATYAPTADTGAGWRVCLVIKSAAGLIFRLCIEHANPGADYNALYTTLAGHGLCDQNGSPASELVDVQMKQVVYV